MPRERRERQLRAVAVAVALSVAATVATFLTVLPTRHVHAESKYADNPLHEWFESLRSPGLDEPCCDEDGIHLNDDQWDMQGAGGHYRVLVEGQWVEVPDDRVVKEPNRAQVPLVWTYHNIDSATGKTTINIRCFLPGAGT